MPSADTEDGGRQIIPPFCGRIQCSLRVPLLAAPSWHRRPGRAGPEYRHRIRVSNHLGQLSCTGRCHNTSTYRFDPIEYGGDGITPAESPLRPLACRYGLCQHASPYTRGARYDGTVAGCVRLGVGGAAWRASGRRAGLRARASRSARRTGVQPRKAYARRFSLCGRSLTPEQSCQADVIGDGNALDHTFEHATKYFRVRVWLE